MRQSLMAWFFMGALALAAFDAFEMMYADSTAAVGTVPEAQAASGKDDGNPPPVVK